MTFLVENVTYRYTRAQEPVLKNVSLAIPRGSITAVVGQSGVGKSTLLYLLGLLWEGTLEEGHISYQGANGPLHYDQLTSGQRARLRLREFGFALQSSYLLPTLTCGENVAMPLALQNVDRQTREKEARRLMEQVDRDAEDPAPAPRSSQASTRQERLIDKFHKLPHDLAGGERRRISLLRGIVHDPGVLLADEPFSNLDHRNCQRIRNLLLDWHRGSLHHNSRRKKRTLLLVTHDLESGYDMAGQFLVFHRNRVVVNDRILTADEVHGVGQLKEWIESDG